MSDPENTKICEGYPTLDDISGIITTLHREDKEQEKTYHAKIEKAIYTEYTYDIFGNLKSFITDNFEDEKVKKDLHKSVDSLIDEFKKLQPQSKQGAGSGGNHFITLLNHCKLCLKKEKKPVKKAAEKKPAKSNHTVVTHVFLKMW